MPETIVDLFREQAVRSPRAVALSRLDRRMDYGDLDRASEDVATRLERLGVERGEVVGVLLDRSPDMVVALLGTLKAGAAYLYLDPTDTPERTEALLDDSEVRVVCTLAEDDRTGVAVAERDGADTRSARRGPAGPRGAHPSSPAYVCYTSGSTGEPRGVLVPHRAVTRLVRDPSWMEVREDDVFFQLTRVGFDVSTFELWMPLTHGRRLALGPPQAASLDLADLAGAVRDEGVTVLWLTTGLFHRVVDHHLDALAGLRHLLAGGDVLSPAHVRRVMTEHPDLVFTNGYGPTENTTFSTCWTTRSSPTGSSVPIGDPVDLSTAVVLDNRMAPVVVGEVGELWVGGDGVALGYLGRASATAIRFVADPAPDARPGSRIYRTGDLVRRSDEGGLELLGRSDDQLKVRGYRVEPRALENDLLARPGVLQAAIVPRVMGPGDTRLIAFVGVGEMPEPTWEAFGARLREDLQDSLAPHLVPWSIVVRDELPLTPNGKLDRRGLPAERVPRNVGNPYVAPRDEVESTLVAVWSEALGVSPVGVEDNFFDLGGHSLLAAELIAALLRKFEMRLPARTLYLRPTIAQLADQLRPTTHGGSAADDRA